MVLDLETLEIILNPLAMKFLSLLDMMACRTPYWAMMLFQMNFSVAVAVTVLYEAASTHLVK